MTPKEYKDNLDKLQKQFETKKAELAYKYADANNPFEIDNIIEDHIGKGRIKGWKVHFGYRTTLPCMVYKCENLTKKGSVNKREPFRNIHQTNILTES